MVTLELAVQRDDGAVPLVVDLDGTLLRSDLLVETAFAHINANPLQLASMLRALRKGKAALKAVIAAGVNIDPPSLPYDKRVLDLIDEAKSAGRPVYLVSASNERYVRSIAEHLGVFDGWAASTESENLSSTLKANKLVKTFGKKQFDYIGNDRADFPVWSNARRSIAVHPSNSVRSRLTAIDPQADILEDPNRGLRRWMKLLRVHQWSKNALVFVPLVTSQRFDLWSVIEAAIAFLAFSLVASSIYILNDVVDIEADRKHPSKMRRPLAAGTVPIFQALLIAPLMSVLGLASAIAISWRLAAVLVGYLLLTTAYSFFLKRKMMIDVVTLAALFTLRVAGGAAALAVPVSEWLLAFSLFIFTALALIKRYVELAARIDGDLPDPTNRNYRKSDLEIVASLAAAASFNAVTIFALYISSETVRALYRHPQALWLVCPILMYWLGRMLLMAQRRLIDDDPIVFALRDRNSILCLGLIILILALAV
jgi:4-hydroxybenzoate polyprenyltransferase/phosphoserine phosphatase